MSQIELRNVSFAYEKKNILTDLSFSVEEGESIGIIGANGVGKSTLLKLPVGLLMGFDGEIRVDNMPVNKENLPDIRAKIGYVFQDSDSQLFMSTAYEDIAFAPRNYGYSEKEVQERVEEALRLTGTEHLKDKQIYKMSGGEKKLVSIATILSMLPEIILMDEPTTALDPRNRRNLIRLLNTFPQTKLIASHDLDFVLDTCRRTILMARGKIISQGPTEEILRGKDLLEQNGLELPLRLQGPSL